MGSAISLNIETINHQIDIIMKYTIKLESQKPQEVFISLCKLLIKKGICSDVTLLKGEEPDDDEDDTDIDEWFQYLEGLGGDWEG